MSDPRQQQRETVTDQEMPEGGGAGERGGGTVTGAPDIERSDRPAGSSPGGGTVTGMADIERPEPPAASTPGGGTVTTPETLDESEEGIE